MTDRILDLSDAPAYLRVEHEQLLIERKEHGSVSVPLAETAVLILAHPQITCTHTVLAGVMEKGGSIIACDRRNLPLGLMLPIQAHSTQTERFAAQASAKLPLKKRLWSQIVREKIKAQGNLLESVRGDDQGLIHLADRVRSGDPANIEAQASKRYWSALFDDSGFRRDRDAEDQNRLLNYGYTVLRAIVGRAICAAGLHPSLGVHHHNRYDAFCLAADLMEPYRPIVDAVVIDLVEQHGKERPLDRETKQALLMGITASYRTHGEVRSLFDLVSRSASSLAKVYMGEGEGLLFPEVLDRVGQ